MKNYFCTLVDGGGCRGYHDGKCKVDPTEICMYRAKNNADYIRNMSDEEMAEWLVHKVKCTGCNAENCDEEFCINLMKEWIEYPCDRQ